MYKTIELTKGEFTTEKMKELKANDCIIVNCSNQLECQSVRSLAYQYAKLYPEKMKEQGVTKITTSRVGENGVRITAFF